VSEIVDRRLRAMSDAAAATIAPVDDDGAAREVVYRQSIMAARIGFVRGLHFERSPLDLPAAQIAARVFPLPPKKVLREEPVPGSTWPLYRLRDGVVEQTVDDGRSRFPTRWFALSAVPVLLTGVMRHLLDLHDNPFREVPGDGGDDA
jgi:hypothetical protein